MNTDSSRAIINEDSLVNTAAVSEMTIQTLLCHRDQIQKKIDDEDFVSIVGQTSKENMKEVMLCIDNALFFQERALQQIHLAADMNQASLTDDAA